MSNIDQVESGNPRNGPEHCISAFPKTQTPYNEEEKDEEEKDLFRYHPI